MRDLARWPMDNGSVIRILDDCASYVIIADHAVQPTSELPSHLAVHDRQIELGSGYKATVHTHPIELVAMSHNNHSPPQQAQHAPAQAQASGSPMPAQQAQAMTGAAP